MPLLARVFRVLSVAPIAAVFTLSAAQSSAPLPAGYLRVEAPAAQRLVVAEKAHHSEIRKLGLHAVPPGEHVNVIVASDLVGKVGKPSSAADLTKLALEKPVAERVEKDGIYDLLLPITDREGRSLEGGFVVMEVPLTAAQSEAEALKIGMAVRDELQAEIESKAALYKP